MGIQRIMAKAVSYVAKSGKTAAKSGKTAAKAVSTGAKAKAPSILSKVETNTAGRILRMQDAKTAFTPVAPYATKVTKTNVPTQQFLDEMLEVGKVDGLKAAKGIYNKPAAADALAAFKHEPVKLQGGKLGITSTPTKKVIEDMHDIAKIDALKNYEEGGRATRAILDRRAAAREAFTKGGDVTPRWALDFNKPCKVIGKSNFKELAAKKFNLKSLDMSAYGDTKMNIADWKDAIDKDGFTKFLKKG